MAAPATRGLDPPEPQDQEQDSGGVHKESVPTDEDAAAATGARVPKEDGTSAQDDDTSVPEDDAAAAAAAGARVPKEDGKSAQDDDKSVPKDDESLDVDMNLHTVSSSDSDSEASIGNKGSTKSKKGSAGSKSKHSGIKHRPKKAFGRKLKDGGSRTPSKKKPSSKKKNSCTTNESATGATAEAKHESVKFKGGMEGDTTVKFRKGEKM
jgi:hypothetical protein